MLDLNTVPNHVLLELVEARTVGYLAGYADGARAERESIIAAAAYSVSKYVNVPPRDHLEELRGNPAGAQAIRETWALTGLREKRPQPVPIDPSIRTAFLDQCRASWGLPAKHEVAA